MDAVRMSGSKKFSESIAKLSVPVSQEPVIKDFMAAYQRKKQHVHLDLINEFELPSLQALPISLALYSSKVSAGLPFPAEEHIEKRLDPNAFLIDHQESTFFVTISGHSMMDAGLLPGDKVVVDRSRIASVGDIILAVVDGEFTVKTLALHAKSGAPRLLPANSTGAYAPIEITEDMQFQVWGVVIGSFRRFK